jgi:hypothetical protein
MHYCAQSEAPDRFHFWTGVSTIAGALRRRVWIDQAYFQWVPNFFIFLIGPPGVVTKSTTINIGYDLLTKLDIPFGAQITTWQALAKDLAESQELIEVRHAEFEPMCALTVSVSELGTFIDTSDKKLIDLLTDLWDGKKGGTKKSTATQGEYSIENPWLNIIGCTTPSWLRDNVTDNIMTGGLASRAIWLYAEDKRHCSAYPGDTVSPTFKADAGRLVEDLEDISKLIGEYTLTDAAKVWGRAWYDDLYHKKIRPNQDDSISGYLSRKQTHMHKLAMILAAARSNKREIDECHLVEADIILMAMETGLPNIYSIIKQTPRTRLAVFILDTVKRNRLVEVSKLYAQIMNTTEYVDFRQAMDAALATGHIRLIMHGTTTMLALK